MSKARNKALPLLLTAVVVLCTVAAMAPTAMAADTPVSDFAALQSAIAAYGSASTDMTITVTQNMNMTAVLTIPENTNGKTLTITGGKTLTRASGVTGDLFTVGSGASLILENIILDGNNVQVTNAAGSLVYVDGGSFTMNAGAVLHKNKYSNGHGGGVSVGNNSSFTLNGGTISGNTVSGGGGGGVVVGTGGSFTMNGGEISGNSTEQAGGGGGGVLVSGGAFTMSGGIISSNTANLTGNGGGVAVGNNSSFTMTGGTISGNSVYSGVNRGGGVYVSTGGSFTVGGTAKIYGNTKGGAPDNVYLDSGYITLGTDENAPAAGMEIHVANPHADNSDVIVNANATAAHAQYFFADDSTKAVVHDGATLKLVYGSKVSDFADLQSAITAYNTASEDMTITVTQDIDITALLTIPENANDKTLTITGGSGITLKRDSSFTNTMFTVGTGAKLVLENITLDGNNVEVTKAMGSLVRVDGGTLTMNAGAVLQNNTRISGGIGGGVQVSSGGSFIMNGGTISGNTGSTGGGVYMDSNSSSFTMTGGEISGNTAYSGGGVFVDNGTLTVGGTAKIYGNTKGGAPDNVYLSDGEYITLGTGENAPAAGMEIHVANPHADNSDVIVNANATADHAQYFFADDSTKAVVHDGVTLKLSALDNFDALQSAIAAYGSAATDMTITVTQSIDITALLTIPENANGKTLTITGGSGITLKRDSSFTNTMFTVGTGAKLVLDNIIIDGNGAEVTDANGLLVRVDGGTLTMNAGAVLQNNTRTGGNGGVSVGNNSSFTMNGGTISGNTGSYGGGVLVFGNNSSFTMNGGIISGNKSTGDGGAGGGVYVYGSFTMTGGEISGNSVVSGNGGGVYVSTSGSFTVGGTAKIKDNTKGGSADNVYLDSCYITLGTPAAGMEIHVANPHADNSDVIVNANATAAHAQYFFADDSTKVVVHDGGKLKLVPSVTITYNANGGTGSDITDKAVQGFPYTVKANTFTRSGYNFSGWNTAADGTGTAYAAGASIASVAANTTLYAQWSVPPRPPVIDGDSGSTTTTEQTVLADGDAAEVSYTQSGETVTLDLPDEKIDEIVEKAEDGVATLDISGAEGATEAVIPAAALGKLAEAGVSAALELPGGTLTLDADALDAISAGGGEVTVSLSTVEPESLTAEQQERVKPGDIVLDISIYAGGTAISELGGTLTVTVPYSGELPVAVWYLNDDGELEKLDCVYDAAGGTVTFTTNHLSLYVIGQDTAWQNPFADVSESDWYYGAVQFAHENGLFAGTSATTFSPNMSMTRAMLVTVLYRMEGEPEVEGMYAAHMMDVQQGAYYENAMGWAVKEGIITGYGEGIYAPDDNITREQLAVMLYRYIQYKGGGFEGAWMFLPEYADRDDIAEWAYEAACYCSMNGIITGKPGNLLDPQGNATRAEVATMLERYMENQP